MTITLQSRIRKQGEALVMMRALLVGANKRLDCLVKYWEDEADLEDIVTLDDGALASAWREQYYDLLKELDKKGLR